MGKPAGEVDGSRHELKRTFLLWTHFPAHHRKQFLLDPGEVPFLSIECDPLPPESQIYEFSYWFLYFHLPGCSEENQDNSDSRTLNLRSFIAPGFVVLGITHIFASTK